jgi:hypothetical protein
MSELRKTGLTTEGRKARVMSGARPPFSSARNPGPSSLSSLARQIRLHKGQVERYTLVILIAFGAGVGSGVAGAEKFKS